MKPRKTKAPATAPAHSEEDKKNVLQLTARAGVSQERQLADLATDGIATNAMTARSFLGPSQPQLSITEMVESLKDHGKRVNANDLAAAEQMLTAQSIALNAIFAEMARRSAINMGEYLDASERYLRLALKAQGQCRATVETLAAIKNPPIVYAKQANIANGPQQVNNGVVSGPNGEPSLPTHAQQIEKRANELLELPDGTRLDAGTQGQAGCANPWLATVDAIHRAKVCAGQGTSGQKQPQARGALHSGH
jgi:hypothetical protein